MIHEDALYRLIKKHGKSEIKESEKSKYVRVRFSNPTEIKYVLKDKFMQLVKQQAESELEEMINGTPGPGTYTEVAKEYMRSPSRSK
jgi:hypothetical protein